MKDPDIPEYLNHKIVVKKIAQDLNLDTKSIERTLKFFFTRGIKYFIKNNEPIDIIGFAKININRNGQIIKERRIQMERIHRNLKMKKYMKKYRDSKSE